MAKSGQKRKRADKAKQQLKTSMKAQGKDRKKKVKTASGIRLPKGLNEVKPEVKTKTLMTASAPKEKVALETQEEGGVKRTKKYRPIKDVLSKLKHPSHFNRSDALKALKEILAECPSAVDGQRAEILRRLLPLSLDVEDQIRTLFVEAFTLLLRLLTAPEKWSHRDLLLAHVSGALSHVSAGVRQDALRAVDALTEHAKEVVASGYQTLLPSCVSQLSGAAASRLSSGVTSKDGVVKDRLQVLRRINTLLNIANESRNKVEDELKPVKMSFKGWKTGMRDDTKRKFVSGSGMTLQEAGSRFREIVDKLFGNEDETNRRCFERSFCERLAPLLLQCFREVMPEENSKNRKSGKKGLKREGAEVMLEAAQIMGEMSEMLQDEKLKVWFDSTFVSGANNFSALCASALALTSNSDNDDVLRRLNAVAAVAVAAAAGSKLEPKSLDAMET